MEIFNSDNSDFNQFLMCNRLVICCRPTSSYKPLSHEEIQVLAIGLKAKNPFFLRKGDSGYLVADTFKEIEASILGCMIEGNYCEGSVDERGLRPTKINVEHPLLSIGLSVLYYEKVKNN